MTIDPTFHKMPALSLTDLKNTVKIGKILDHTQTTKPARTITLQNHTGQKLMHTCVRIPRGFRDDGTVSGRPLARSHDLVSRHAVRTGTRLRGVRERKTCRVDYPVIPYQRDRHLSRLPDPQPLAAELGNVWDYAQHGFLAPVDDCLF